MPEEAPRRPRSRTRTLRLDPSAIVKLLQSIGPDGDVRVFRDPIPNGCAITAVRVFEDDNTIEIDLFGQWDPDLPDAVGLVYQRRVAHNGEAGDWGPPNLRLVPGER